MNKKYKFKKDRIINLYYNWTCGDGCCSNEEYSDELFSQGEIIEVFPNDNRRLSIRGLYIDDDYECAKIYNYVIDDLLEQDIIEEIR